MSVFIPISKKGNAKECSNYCTTALIFGKVLAWGRKELDTTERLIWSGNKSMSTEKYFQGDYVKINRLWKPWFLFDCSLLCLWFIKQVFYFSFPEKSTVFLAMSMKVHLTFRFLRVYIKGFSMGITEVFSTATPLLKGTLSFADGFMYMKM